MKLKLFLHHSLFEKVTLLLVLLGTTSAWGKVGTTENSQADLRFHGSAYSTPLAPSFFLNQGPSVVVSDVESLYEQVNTTANAGATIILAPNTYFLSAIGPSGPRPNGGRLELQEGMSLKGSSNNSEDTVIDAAGLPIGSYQTPALTGAIRIGRGVNSIESITVRNAVNGSAAIETDLNLNGWASIRILNVTATGNARGLDIRNIGPAAVGRVVDADIRDSRFIGNTLGNGQGIRLLNVANEGVIIARLKKNFSSGNRVGMLAANNSASSASISVELSSDEFDGNGAGMIILGGLSTGPLPSNGNTVTLFGHASSFSDNTSPIAGDGGGLVILGGDSTQLANQTSNNVVDVRLRGCKLENNQMMDLGAFAARYQLSATAVAGTNNRITIDQNGPGNPSIVEVFVGSIPTSPSSGNIVIY